MDQVEIERIVAPKLLGEFREQRRRFILDVKHDDILLVFLKIHLYIEKELVELTEKFFKHPKKVDFKFKRRLDVLYALGVIDKELYDPITKINDIRNNFAHKLDYSFTESEYKSLKDTLSKEILIEYKKDREVSKLFNKKLTYNDETKVLLSGIWATLKSDVLFSFKIMQIITTDYQQKYFEELKKYI